MLPGEKYLEKLEESGKSRRTAVKIRKIRKFWNSIFVIDLVSTYDMLKTVCVIIRVLYLKTKCSSYFRQFNLGIMHENYYAVQNY